MIFSLGISSVVSIFNNRIMYFINVLKLFIYLNVIFVLKGNILFLPSENFISILLGVRDSSDLDTRVPEIWRVLRDVVCSRKTNLVGFRLHISTSVWFNILK